MFSCRAAWQRCGPLARRATYRLPRDGVQQRPMSSVPGGSGENIVYAVLCGGAFVGAVSYAYNTVSTDHTRFNDRIAEIKARPKTEWVPKPWPPKSKDDEDGGDEKKEEAALEKVGKEAEVGEEAAADVDAETVVEAVAEAVAEAAEVVVEAAEVIAEAAHDVETVAEEVAQMAEAVEEAAQAVAEPAAVTAEEPESNVLLAAASTLEVPKIAEVKKELVHSVEDTKEEDSQAQVEAKPVEEIALLEKVPTTEEVVPGEAAPVVEEASAPGETTPVVKDVSAWVESTPVVEDASTPVEAAPVVDEASAPVEAAPVVDEASAAVVENVSTPMEAAPVVDEGSAPVEAAPVTGEALDPVENAPAAEETSAPVEATLVPEEDVTIALAEEPVITKVGEEITVSPTAEVASVQAEEAVAVPAETLAEGPNREYIVVVLEGTAKAEKRPKILGVGPMTGRIIPAPDGDDDASKGRRRLLRMQMQ